MEIRIHEVLGKCAALNLKQGVKVQGDGIVLPDEHSVSEIEEARYKYLWLSQGVIIKVREMKDSIRQEPFGRVKLVAKAKFYLDSVMKTKNV